MVEMSYFDTPVTKFLLKIFLVPSMQMHLAVQTGVF